MHFVIDSNEYIFAFGLSKEESSLTLIQDLRSRPDKYKIFICRSIINEVQRKLISTYLKEFYNFIYSMANVEEDYVVPFELGAKYEGLGLKPGDAFIAAYAEYVRAEFLVTENRHFLSRRSDLPFQVVTASECLKCLKT